MHIAQCTLSFHFLSMHVKVHFLCCHIIFIRIHTQKLVNVAHNNTQCLSVAVSYLGCWMDDPMQRERPAFCISLLLSKTFRYNNNNYVVVDKTTITTTITSSSSSIIEKAFAFCIHPHTCLGKLLATEFSQHHLFASSLQLPFIAFYRYHHFLQFTRSKTAPPRASSCGFLVSSKSSKQYSRAGVELTQKDW